MKKKISLIAFLIFCINFPISRNKKKLKNNIIQLDNFDIMHKSTSLNKKINNENEKHNLNIKIYSIINLIEMWIAYGHEMQEFSDAFILFFKNFFGIRLIKNKFHNKEKKHYFIENIIEKISFFYFQASYDLQYLCNIQIQYLLSFQHELLKKISSDYIYQLINLGYKNEQIFQFKTKKEENKIKLNEDILNELLTESAEIGILKNEYIYNLFETQYINILNNNKIHEVIKLTKSILLEKIIYNKNNNIIKILIKDYYKYKENIKYCNENDFIIWLLNKDQVNTSIITLINEDSLFLLFLIKLIDESIKKDSHKLFYSYLSDNQIEIINKIAIKANSILSSLLNLFKIKYKINWDTMPLIVLNKNRIHDILNYLELLI